MKEPDSPYAVLCRTKGCNAHQEVQTRQYPGFVWIVNFCQGYQELAGSVALIPQTTHSCQSMEAGFTLVKSTGWLMAVGPDGDYNNSAVRWYHIVACPFCGQRLEGSP